MKLLVASTRYYRQLCEGGECIKYKREVKRINLLVFLQATSSTDAEYATLKDKVLTAFHETMEKVWTGCNLEATIVRRCDELKRIYDLYNSVVDTTGSDEEDFADYEDGGSNDDEDE